MILTDFANFKPTLLPAVRENWFRILKPLLFFSKDNPADYAFFFDTSRRRTCYIAPERFVHLADFGSYSHDTTDITTLQRNKHYAPLTAAMDIFSLGSAILFTLTLCVLNFLHLPLSCLLPSPNPYSCVIAELFLDGQQLFDLSQLLDYCTKDYNPEQQLKKIPDKSIRVSSGLKYSRREALVEGGCWLNICTDPLFNPKKSNSPSK